MYRIVIDRSLCDGFGYCARLAPDLFDLDGDEVAVARCALTDDPAAVEAADACPAGAIAVFEEEAA